MWCFIVPNLFNVNSSETYFHYSFFHSIIDSVTYRNKYPSIFAFTPSCVLFLFPSWSPPHLSPKLRPTTGARFTLLQNSILHIARFAQQMREENRQERDSRSCMIRWLNSMTTIVSNTATLYVRCELSNYDGNRSITITWDRIPPGATHVVHNGEDSSYLNTLEVALVGQHERWNSVAICVGQPPDRDQLLHLLMNHKDNYDSLRFSFMSGPKLSDYVRSLIGNITCHSFSLSVITDCGCYFYEDITKIINNSPNLKHLYITACHDKDENSVTGETLYNLLVKIVCDTSSPLATYNSNHTLSRVNSRHWDESIRDRKELDALLKLNDITNKDHVAKRKILKYHPNIDMVPLFDWNKEGEGERDLKALPYVIAWFERAQVVEEYGDNDGIATKKLSAMYQFAKAMPLLFVPASHTKKVSNNKRKRNKWSGGYLLLK